jgi:hypothetical protein
MSRMFSLVDLCISLASWAAMYCSDPDCSPEAYGLRAAVSLIRHTNISAHVRETPKLLSYAFIFSNIYYSLLAV